jgi:exopolyphosphatase / guanosine-5'-triphosphate,3'-diphosphate pyrophosphatase
VRKAVVDVGSNSVLLVVAEKSDNAWHPVLETSAVTALGEGTRETGLLSESSMVSTLEALRRAYDQAEELGAQSVHAAATMACRIASNAPEFLERAQRQGTPVTILSGEDEAQLGFLAVAEDPTFSAASRLSMIDVGGHSTELVTGERGASGWEIRFRHSFPIGTWTLRNGLLKTERNGPAELFRAMTYVDETILHDYAATEAGLAVAVGATPTNLVSIRNGWSEWRPDEVHGTILEYEEVGKAVGWLCAMDDQERAAVPGLEPGRERTLHVGALILERFLHAIRVESCAVSIRGWRHALLAQDAAPVDSTSHF